MRYAIDRRCGRKVESVETRVLDVADPTDYGKLFRALAPICAELKRKHPPESWTVDVVLSAGTPQAQTLWVILVQAGILEARMLQVIPAAFVPVPHPRAIRGALEQGEQAARGEVEQGGDDRQGGDVHGVPFVGAIRVG